MRRFVLVAMMVGFAQGAVAADMPDLPVLRGLLDDTPRSGLQTNWDGYYVGGQFGYSAAGMQFDHATQSLTSYMLRNAILDDVVPQWPLLQNKSASATSYGGYAGRNWQWTDAVLGVEVNYNHFSGASSSSSDSMERLITNPAGSNPPSGHTYVYDARLDGNAYAKIRDVLTFRARAGWAAGIFMPYAFGGLALGLVDASRSATLAVTRHDQWNETVTVPVGTGTGTVIVPHDDLTPYQTLTNSESKTGLVTYGFTAGGGLEVSLLDNVLLRAEYEYVRLSTTMGMDLHTNSVRGGFGIKF